jgi:hypothetical protein
MTDKQESSPIIEKWKDVDLCVVFDPKMDVVTGPTIWFEEEKAMHAWIDFCKRGLI